MLAALSRPAARKPLPAARLLAAGGSVGRPRSFSARHVSPLMLSARAMNRYSGRILENIDLMVCDMAGTTVQEGGLVYKVLQQSMTKRGLQVSDHDMEPWHGAKKEAVIEHFARKAGTAEEELDELITKTAEDFISAIDEAYFDEAATIGPIESGLYGYFKALRASGIKIALDTGYPANIQRGLVQRLKLDEVVDAYISSYEVPQGRPYPYMVHRLMERLNIESVKRVAKVGDSVRDIEEGVNAGCGLVIGVLSGADKADALFAAGADVVAEYVTDLPLPRMRAPADGLRLPDLS